MWGFFAYFTTIVEEGRLPSLDTSMAKPPRPIDRRLLSHPTAWRKPQWHILKKPGRS
jgi:hypothetical protein